ncbi:hypothetical protein LTR36_003851 [Oleoguttula mirabilis]|uniref:C2H2-type domain-containing protein n=1 Tax=Oleoguttula mirabilis TaxID=1507867 RepID=A0AAV9JII3_9PEZI|nr:hypothetical protein LTR36_003851 [Oleoguttula mirabilis]
MAPYNANQYGTYYDPAGSQANHPTGYRYQATTTSASPYPSTATANYQSPGYQGYGNTYGNQQYGENAQGGSSTTSQAASALSNLSSSNYAQPAATTAASTNANYDSSTWGTSNYASYNTANAQVPNRTQSNNSPLYATQSTASTFGRLSVPEQTQSTPSSNTYAQQAYQNARTSATPSNQSYQTAYTQPAQQPQAQQPQRYASPLHAVQAQQQSHSKQSSRSVAHQPSPQMAPQSVQQASNNRQQSASVEPSATTVNPSQVYDDSAERRRKAQIEAEKRRKREQEQAARKAEEDRIAAEKRKEEEEKQRAEKQEAMKKAEAEHKAEERRKKREEKRQSKTAATALTKMASSGTMDAVVSEAPPANPEEAEMRAMFQKMREFNAKNPAMLAKLWEEERKTHSSQSPQSANVTPAPAPPQKAATSTMMAAPQNSTPTQQYRPFQKPPPPPPPPPKTAAQNMTTSTQPMASQSTTSLWPPQKKGSLAEAAAKWLMALPENTGKAISKGSVLKILEANPSYVQLCEALESIGLRFERSLLARELLKAVPEGLKTPAQLPSKATPFSAINGTAAQINGPTDVTKKKRGRPFKDSLRASGGDATSRPTSNSGTVNYEAPSFTSLADAAREVNSMGEASGSFGMQSGPVQPAQPSPYFAQPQAPNGSRAPSQSQAPEQKPTIKPEEPRRPPANKEEAARKTFGDLVDLTAEDSDEEGPPKKVLQTTNGQMNGVSLQQQPPQQQPSQFGFKQFKQPMAFQDFYRPGQRPAHPVMPGQGSMHPSGPPPPAQMLAPRPPQPPPPQLVSRPKGPSLEHLQQERVRGKMLVEPIMRDRVARKSRYDPRTIARDVLLATGRHPDMRALNAHLNTMQRLLGTHGGGYETEGGRGDRSDLSTIRWDIIDPAEPQSAKTAKVAGKRLRGAAASGEDTTTDADDEDDEPAPSIHVTHQIVDNGDGTQQYVSVYAQLNGKDKPKKRRGRPPRSSMPGINFIPSTQGGERQHVSIGQRDLADTPNQRTFAATAPRSAPAGGRAAGGSPAGTPSGNAPIGYAAFRHVDDSGNVVKKKGRPFGWRKSVHSREAQGLEPAKTGQNPGSRLRQSQGPKDANLIEPKYQAWKCQWKGCQAELHNLETLKKHVVKLHGKPTDGGVYDCLWQPCEAESEHVVGKGKGKASGVASFSGIDSWMNHIDKEHLQSVAWEQGDGPRGGMSDHHATDSEAYLSDAQGRSVTPIIVPNFDGLAGATSQVLPSALRRPGRPEKEVAHMTKDERKAAADLEKLEAHKRAVGPSMDKTGVRMANKKRRLGFLDDEDFEDEVESEGEHVEEEKGE